MSQEETRNRPGRGDNNPKKGGGRPTNTARLGNMLVPSLIEDAWRFPISRQKPPVAGFERKLLDRDGAMIGRHGTGNRPALPGEDGFGQGFGISRRGPEDLVESIVGESLIARGRGE